MLSNVKHAGLTMYGVEFNKIYKNTDFYILTKSHEIYYGQKIETGLNISNKFIPYICDDTSGFHFVNLINLVPLTDYKRYIRKVKIPNDAIIYIGFEQFKTNKFILEDKIEIKNFNKWQDPIFQPIAAKIDPCTLRFMNNTTEETQLNAVKYNGLSIAFIKNPSNKVKKCALHENPQASHYIKN